MIVEDSIYIKNFVDDHESYFDEINKIDFLPRSDITFKIYGNILELPRDKQFFGDVNIDNSYPLYRYGGNYYPKVKPFNSILSNIRDTIKEATEQYCNHLVVNRYLNGSDHIGFHRDKNKDFVDGSSVMTISLGNHRTLRLKHNTSNNKIDVVLEPGSLFILGPNTNSLYKHSIIKTKSDVGTRISLTYRSIKTLFDPVNNKIL